MIIIIIIIIIIIKLTNIDFRGRGLPFVILPFRYRADISRAGSAVVASRNVGCFLKLPSARL